MRFGFAAVLLLAFLSSPTPALPGSVFVAAAPRPDTAPATADRHELDADLRTALRERDLPRALALIERGATIDLSAPDGKTTLMMAAAAGDVGAVTKLLDRGADVRAVNRNGGTALLYAALQPDPETVRLLIGRGAVVDHASSNGWSALTVAAAKGHRRVVRALLDAGADPDHQDIYGWTPLMRAIDTDHPATAQDLLSGSTLTIDRVNDQGQTALHLAAANGILPVARQLMKRGSDPEQRDNTGRTPYDLARAAGHEELARLLRPR